MSRVDRVLDLLDFLRSHEIVTVAEIAAGLGVGRRTVLRDLATLRGRGWPVRSESGPGGGVYLDRGRGVATVHLDTEGIVALWVATKLSASATRLPWSSAARRALDKIFASLPEARRRHLRRLVSRVVVGETATARIRADLGQPARNFSPRSRQRSPATCASVSTMSTVTARAASALPSPMVCSSRYRRGTSCHAMRSRNSRACSAWTGSDRPRC